MDSREILSNQFKGFAAAAKATNDADKVKVLQEELLKYKSDFGYCEECEQPNLADDLHGGLCGGCLSDMHP